MSVFATHTLIVDERASFYEYLGLTATKFDKEVIRRTNKTSARAFPRILDVDNPDILDIVIDNDILSAI
ncbi:MAG: hypothetical protein ACQZ3M_05780 [cyanobacterium endosymbiont of Rhopalodia fuxianensis]